MDVLILIRHPFRKSFVSGLALTLFLIFNSYINLNTFADEITKNEETHLYTLGTELDALPFATGGYYFSLIGGYDHFRLRGIASLVNPPAFAYPSDRFANLNLHAYALIVDYFFKPAPEAFWLGIGLEKWLGKIDSVNRINSGSFNESVSTLGVGYVWIFYKNFYLNPWAASFKDIGRFAECGLRNLFATHSSR